MPVMNIKFSSRFLWIVPLFAIAMASTPATAATLPDYWLEDWDEARQTASKTNKPLLAVFSAEWCGPCQYMIENVFNQGEVITALGAWVPVYLDAEKGDNPELATRYGISAFPTFVMFNSKGQEEGRMSGARQSEDFVDDLENHLALARLVVEVRAELSQNPENPTLWKKLGDTYIDLDQKPSALSAYEKGVYYDPSNETGVAADFYFHSSFPILMTELESSAERFFQFESKFPDSPLLPRVYVYRVLIAFNMDQIEEAKAIVHLGLKRFPDSDQTPTLNRFLRDLESLG